MIHIDELANRIAELEDLARSEGRRLSMPASVIAQYELQGAVVDLRSGNIIMGGADVRVWPAAALYTADSAGEGQP